MLKTNDKISKGKLKLQSYAHPPLAAGTYTLKSQILSGSTIPQDDLPEKELKVTVKAPRFTFGTASAFHSYYPLPGSTGAYSTTLPHIVLNRKTLPWERLINRNNSNDKRPWMCLLLLTEDELGKDAVKELESDKFISTDANFVKPDIILNAEEKKGSKIKVLEIPVAFFKKIAPLGDELDYLVHTRQVDTANKEENENNDKGWFSVMVSNRLPAKQKSNNMFLVSVEGYSEILDNAISQTDTRTIRLTVLKQWLFTDMGGTFEQLVDKLNETASPLRIEFPEKMLSKRTLNAFHYGYTPVNHKRRNNQPSVSWYRGPLVPLAIAKPPAYNYKNADLALRFDEGSGLFDISYAVAWQLGRLLALKNPAFAAAINNWKNAYNKERPIEVAKKILADDKTTQINLEKLADIVNDVESDEVLTDYLIGLWTKSI